MGGGQARQTLDIQGDAWGRGLGEEASKWGRAWAVGSAHQKPKMGEAQLAQALVHKTAGFTLSFQLKTFF